MLLINIYAIIMIFSPIETIQTFCCRFGNIFRTSQRQLFVKVVFLKKIC